MKVNIYDLMENIEDSSVRMEDNSVVSSERIKELTRMKIQNASNKKRSSKKTILTVGIAVAVVAALGATAFAAINGGLANLSFGKSSWGPSIEEDIKNSVPPREFVSSQGYPDSPEYQATKEWIAFDDSYDREFKILDAFDAETKRTGTDPFAEKYGDYLFTMSEKVNTKYLNVIRYGVKVGEVIKDEIKFDHHYAHFVANLDNEMDISFEDLIKYYQGETLNYQTKKGYILLKYQGINVDIAKSDGRIIKNRLPKGLRRKYLF